MLQVEDDSNLIAYSHDFTNISLISYVRQRHEKEDILVRAHPGSLFRLRDDVFTIDDSANSLAFINQCNEVFTINSSVGLEAILTGKKTTVLGDCSYAFINELAESSATVNAAAFYLFSYLVPFDLVFNQEYLKFRLGHPEEREIIGKHIEFYSADMPGSFSPAAYTLSSLINEAISQDKAMRKILENSLQEHNKQIDLLKNQLAAEAAERQKLAATLAQLQDKVEIEVEVAEQAKAGLLSAVETKQEEINRMRNSLSWKLSMPVRMSGRICRGEFSTIKAMTRHYATSGNGALSRFLLSGGLLSKSRYKTALRLVCPVTGKGLRTVLNA